MTLSGACTFATTSSPPPHSNQTFDTLAAGAGGATTVTPSSSEARAWTVLPSQCHACLHWRQLLAMQAQSATGRSMPCGTLSLLGGPSPLSCSLSKYCSPRLCDDACHQKPTKQNTLSFQSWQRYQNHFLRALSIAVAPPAPGLLRNPPPVELRRPRALLPLALRCLLGKWGVTPPPRRAASSRDGAITCHRTPCLCWAAAAAVPAPLPALPL